MNYNITKYAGFYKASLNLLDWLFNRVHTRSIWKSYMYFIELY